MASWDKTLRLRDRLRDDGKIAVINGISHYLGRPIISRDSPVDGGVYLGEKGREAIVVDSVKYTELRRLYKTSVRKSLEKEMFLEDNILKAVYDTVFEALPNQSDMAVERLMKMLDVRADTKVALDVFLETGIGLCRHDSLTCAALLELFRNDGLIDGRISVDRNCDSEYGSHAWCRYMKKQGGVWILDVALANFGRIEAVSGSISHGKWPYHRPEDTVSQQCMRNRCSYNMNQNETTRILH